MTQYPYPNEWHVLSHDRDDNLRCTELTFTRQTEQGAEVATVVVHDSQLKAVAERIGP